MSASVVLPTFALSNYMGERVALSHFFLFLEKTIIFPVFLLFLFSFVLINTCKAHNIIAHAAVRSNGVKLVISCHHSCSKYRFPVFYHVLK